ncbi:hypothetical protein [Geoalkalibacter halelectricus]|uniref:hypothetical protein n=1 Tax=Geoalkalibacter halelectricus TaxID=2847045 RepID=UPI003D190326
MDALREATRRVRFALIGLMSVLLATACAPAPNTSPASTLAPRPPAAQAGRPSAPAAPLEIPGFTGIAGEVRDVQGRPAVGAFVYAYLSDRGGLRGPADFGAVVDADGRYYLDLHPGSYYLVARQRAAGEPVGPPRSGDAWAPHPGNPLEVHPETLTRADFRLRTVSQPQIMKQGTLTGGDTGFSGQIQDAQGRPVSGATVMAYGDLNFQRMPDHTALATGDDGLFTLYVPEAGSYCLVVRTRTRGQPIRGELYGTLGVGEQACRAVEKGQIRDLGVIEVRPYR